jgi:hypothetical protein
MFHCLVIVVLLILASAPVDAAILKGVIFANEMNGSPIANVVVADQAQTTNPSVSDDLGRFTLEFRQRRAGDTVNIIVKKEGYLVVNEILLLQFAARRVIAKKWCGAFTSSRVLKRLRKLTKGA